MESVISVLVRFLKVLLRYGVRKASYGFKFFVKPKIHKVSVGNQAFLKSIDALEIPILVLFDYMKQLLLISKYPGFVTWLSYTSYESSVLFLFLYCLIRLNMCYKPFMFKSSF